MFACRADGFAMPQDGERRKVKLYVCYGTFDVPVRGHACRTAHQALRDAGYEPEVVRTYGFGGLPGPLNDLTPRRKVKQLTGQHWVPVLELDDGTAVRESRAIVAWAQAHPANA
jgi:hypothetical protein